MIPYVMSPALVTGTPKMSHVALSLSTKCTLPETHVACFVQDLTWKSNGIHVGNFHMEITWDSLWTTICGIGHMDFIS